jgi:N-acetylglutamate synthase-like GNAT family acetyltransferase
MIRRATVDDAAEIARLSAQLGYPATIAAFAERLRLLQSRDTHAVLVHEGEGNRLAGFVGLEQRLMIESGERVEIVGLVVDERARRTGTGRRLIAAAEDWARARGMPELFLRSNVLRAEAHPFYEQLGFLRTKTQHAYVRPLR